MEIGSGQKEGEDVDRKLDDVIRWIKFGSVAWTQAADGFFYSRFPEPEEGQKFQSLNLNHKLYFSSAWHAAVGRRVDPSAARRARVGFSSDHHRGTAATW